MSVSSTYLFFFHLYIFPITLCVDIMIFLDNFFHVDGQSMCILESPLIFWTPNILTFTKFRHTVSKSWLRPCYWCHFVHPLPLNEPFRSHICFSVVYQKIFITRQKVNPLYSCWFIKKYLFPGKKSSRFIVAGTVLMLIKRHPCI